jgi:hypothetical protein
MSKFPIGQDESHWIEIRFALDKIVAPYTEGAIKRRHTVKSARIDEESRHKMDRREIFLLQSGWPSLVDWGLAKLTQLASESEHERLVVDSELGLVRVIRVDVSAYGIGVGDTLASERGHVEGKSELESGIAGGLVGVGYPSILPILASDVENKSINTMRCCKIDVFIGVRYSGEPMQKERHRNRPWSQVS